MVKKSNPSAWYICDLLLLFHIELNENVGGLLVGPKGMLAPPPKLLGGGMAAPPSPSSYAYASIFGPDKHTELLKICFRTLVKKIRIFLFWKLI